MGLWPSPRMPRKHDRKPAGPFFSTRMVPKVIRAPIVALIASYAISYCYWLLNLQERIFFALLADCRLGTMARNDDRLVR
jgi:hypothetical protein